MMYNSNVILPKVGALSSSIMFNAFINLIISFWLEYKPPYYFIIALSINYISYHIIYHIIMYVYTACTHPWSHPSHIRGSDRGTIQMSRGYSGLLYCVIIAECSTCHILLDMMK